MPARHILAAIVTAVAAITVLPGCAVQPEVEPLAERGISLYALVGT